MSALFVLSGATTHDPQVAAWFAAGELRALAEPWFARVRASGPDVRELLHDGHPTACVGGAAFAYVDAFAGHLNLGFFHGADLPDPAGLLQGAGKRMRHIKIRWGEPIDAPAVGELIAAAYRDIRARLSEQA